MWQARVPTSNASNKAKERRSPVSILSRMEKGNENYGSLVERPSSGEGVPEERKENVKAAKFAAHRLERAIGAGKEGITEFKVIIKSSSLSLILIG